MSCFRNNLIKTLKKLSIIDSRDNVIDNNKLRAYNKALKKYFNNNYQISVDQVIEQSDNKVNINLEILEFVSSLEDVRNIDVNFSPAPNFKTKFDKYGLYKTNLVANSKKVLQQLKNNKDKSNVKNYQKSLENISKLEDLIQKSEIEIIKIKKLDNTDKFLELLTEDIEYIDTISNNIDLNNINQIIESTRFFEAVSTLDKNNPIFKSHIDDEGKPLNPDLIEKFKPLQQKILTIRNRLDKKEVSLINEILIQETGKDYENAIQDKALKDTSLLDMFLMDITNGIFSHNGVLPQVMMKRLKKHFIDEQSITSNFNDRLNNLEEKVIDKLKELGHHNNVAGIEGPVFDIFRTEDENGILLDSIVQINTPLYYKERNEALKNFNTKLNKALSTKRFNTVSRVFKDRDNWYRKNTLILDFNKLSEFNANANDTYKNELLEILGEKDYNLLIERQKQLLRDYGILKESYELKIMEENGVLDKKDLNPKANKKIKNWELRNDPELYIKHLNSSSLKSKINNYANYNIFIPRKTKVKLELKGGKLLRTPTTVKTKYYSKKYKTIIEDPVLAEFHSLLVEFNNRLVKNLPEHIGRNFKHGTLPAIKKNILELLFTKSGQDFSILQQMKLLPSNITEGIRKTLRNDETSTMSYARVDPITGESAYKVNDSFLQDNEKLIKEIYNIEWFKFQRALNKPITDKTILDYTELNDNSKAYLLDLFNSKNLYNLQLKHPSIDFNSFNPSSLIKSQSIQEAIKNNSFDLFKIMRIYSQFIGEYAARSNALPELQLLKSHYQDIKKNSVNNTNKSVLNVRSKESRLEGSRQQGNKQMDSWFNRAVLGNYESKSEFGDTVFTEEEKEKSFFNSLGLNSKVLLNDEKLLKKKLVELLEKLNKDKDKLELQNASKESVTEIKDKIVKIEAYIKTLGKTKSIASITDAIFNFIRFKGLGWNIPSATTNFLEGQISNMINASKGLDFTASNIYRANKILRGSFLKNLTKGRVSSKESIKLSLLMRNLNVMQDQSNETQKADRRSAFNTISLLNPFELTQRVEFMNQGALLIALMLDQKIKSIDGKKELNVWDALDEKGVLNAEYRTKENIKNWETLNGDDYKNFKIKLDKIITNFHGDYEQLRGVMAKETISGKALLMFKTWMSRQFYEKFAILQEDVELGREHKGRFKSHTMASGTMHGVIVGSVFGLPGIAIGGVLGAFAGKQFGQKNDSGFNYIQELALVTKDLFMNILKLPVNTIAGNEVIKETDFNRLNTNQLDLANYKANIMDMSITLSWIGLLIFTKALMWDDEDKQDSERRRMHNYFANKFMQLSGNATMYLNPVATYDNTFANLPVMKFLTDVGKTATAANAYFEGQDTIGTGVNAGESKLWNQTEKTFFPSIIRKGVGFEKDTKTQYQSSVYDSWFDSTEKKAGQKLKNIRAVKRKELIENKNLTKEEAAKEVRKIIPSKKKDQTNVELLEKLGLS